MPWGSRKTRTARGISFHPDRCFNSLWAALGEAEALNEMFRFRGAAHGDSREVSADQAPPDPCHPLGVDLDATLARFKTERALLDEAIAAMERLLAVQRGLTRPKRQRGRPRADSEDQQRPA